MQGCRGHCGNFTRFHVQPSDGFGFTSHILASCYSSYTFGGTEVPSTQHPPWCLQAGAPVPGSPAWPGASERQRSGPTAGAGGTPGHPSPQTLHSSPLRAQRPSPLTPASVVPVTPHPASGDPFSPHPCKHRARHSSPLQVQHPSPSPQRVGRPSPRTPASGERFAPHPCKHRARPASPLQVQHPSPSPLRAGPFTPHPSECGARHSSPM